MIRGLIAYLGLGSLISSGAAVAYFFRIGGTDENAAVKCLYFLGGGTLLLVSAVVIHLLVEILEQMQRAGMQRPVEYTSESEAMQ